MIEELSVTEPVYVVHQSPIGWEPPFYMARVRLDYSRLPGQIEQLPLKELGDGLFRIMCVPFCADGLAYQDVVALDPDGIYVHEVRQRSGHQVLRALLRPRDEAGLAAVTESLVAVARWLGVAHEHHGDRFIAFDVSVGMDPQPLIDSLQKAADDGHLYWEWGDNAPFTP